MLILQNGVKIKWANAIASESVFWDVGFRDRISANLFVNLDKRRHSFYDVSKPIFDGTKRGQKTWFAVKTLGTLIIKDFSRFLETAKKAKSPFQPLDFVSRQNWLWESWLERVSEGGVSL
jgi:hypothetical protein